MNYRDRLSNVTVLGAAGKMGSGILLLTAVEMADLKLSKENIGREFVLNAVDVSDKGLTGIMEYLRIQVRKIAEKKRVFLRKVYEERKDLIENFEIIDQYIADVMCIVRPTTRIEASFDSTLVFEAVNENPELKVKLFKLIDENSNIKPWFFTNTSSVPIHLLNEKAALEGRIIGFHFYNPPAVQKLVELISSSGTLPQLKEFALTYARKLKKIVVESNDFAGFIGNGHFMRDALYGIKQSEKISKEIGFPASVYAVNRVSQELLVRPMGIFQLIDYVGIDVCSFIMEVMDPYLKDETLHSELLDKMIETGVKGGQNPDGSQKNGFLKYERGRPVGVFNIEKKEYVALEDLENAVSDYLGALPESVPAWKSVIRSSGKEKILQAYFESLTGLDSRGAKLGVDYLVSSDEIGNQLVNSGVAKSIDDVNTVMLTGFFHAYGPVNEYVKQVKK